MSTHRANADGAAAGPTTSTVSAQLMATCGAISAPSGNAHYFGSMTVDNNANTGVCYLYDFYAGILNSTLTVHTYKEPLGGMFGGWVDSVGEMYVTGS